MPVVVLQQVSSAFARKNASGTLEKPVRIRFLSKYIDHDLLASLQEVAPEGIIRIWGAKLERGHQFVKMPPRQSIVLFRRGRTIYAHGAIAETTINEVLAEYLWGRDKYGDTWPLIFFLRRITLIDKQSAQLNAVLGRKENDNWQGMTAINIKDTPRLQEYFANELSGTDGLV